MTLIWYFSARSSVLGCKSWSSVSPMPVPVYMSTHRWLVLLHAYAHVLRRRGVKSTLSHPPRSLRLQPPTTGLQSTASQLQERECGGLWWSVNVHSEARSPRLASPSHLLVAAAGSVARAPLPTNDTDTDTCIHSLSLVHSFIRPRMLRCSEIPKTCHFQSACNQSL